MDDWRPPELQQLTTQSSVEADERVHHRLHEDLVYGDAAPTPATNLIHELASARGLKTYEFGPKSIDELRNEQIRLQKWGSKFAGANQVLRNEVESLKVELQKAYATDPTKSGQHVTKEAYDLLARDYEAVKLEYNKLKNEKGLAADHLARLRLARDEADDQRNESIQQAASAVDTVAKLKTQLVDAQRIAMQKQGAVQDLDHRMTELQSRYDILAHHVLQLGEEKTSLLEALRERQSQLDFCLAQLQILDRDSKASDFWRRRCKELEDELAKLKSAFEQERKKLMDEIDRLNKLLKDCGEARAALEAKLKTAGSGGGSGGSGGPAGPATTHGPTLPTGALKTPVKTDNSTTKQGSGKSAKKPATEMPKVEHDAKVKSMRPAQKNTGGVKEEETTAKKTREYKEGTEKIDASKAADGEGKKAPEEVMRHRGLVIRVRWHPTSGKHTFGTRHLQIDSEAKILGWAKKADAPVSKVIKFSEIKRVAYGYASHMTDYKRRFDCPPGVKTPSSGSGNDDDLTASPVGPARGMLATWPKISLTTCFSIITRDGRVFDFFTATDSEAFDWIMRLSRVLKNSDVAGLHDRISFLAARGWTRLIENCCIRQITCRRLLIEGLEKAGVFAASTGLGTGQGTRKPRVSATKTGGTNAKVFKGGAGLSFKGTPSVSNDKSWMKKTILPQPKDKTSSPKSSDPKSSSTGGTSSVTASAPSTPKTSGATTPKSSAVSTPKASSGTATSPKTSDSSAKNTPTSGSPKSSEKSADSSPAKTKTTDTGPKVKAKTESTPKTTTKSEPKKTSDAVVKAKATSAPKTKGEASPTVKGDATPKVKGEAKPKTESVKSKDQKAAPKDPATESTDGKAKEGKTKEGKAKEGKAKESKAEEGKAKEGKAAEGKAKDGKAKEAKGKGGKAKSDGAAAKVKKDSAKAKKDAAKPAGETSGESATEKGSKAAKDSKAARGSKAGKEGKAKEGGKASKEGKAKQAGKASKESDAEGKTKSAETKGKGAKPSKSKGENKAGGAKAEPAKAKDAEGGADAKSPKKAAKKEEAGGKAKGSPAGGKERVKAKGATGKKEGKAKSSKSNAKKAKAGKAPS